MSSRSARDPQWGVLRGCAVNECFTVGAFEVKFDVSAIKGARPRMEDRWAVARHPDANEPYVLFAVFDGHGGDAVSSFLAARFSETLFERASNGESGTGQVSPAALLRRDPSEALRRACLACDEEVVARFPAPAGFRSGPGPGSTAVVALFALTEENPRAFVACVGDSRCVAADEHGAVVFETVDQRPSRVEERARVEALGGTVRVVGGVARAAGVLAVSRAFGNAGIKACVKADPEVSTLALESVDSSIQSLSGSDRATTRPPSDVHTVILCSDGLTDVVASDRAAEATVSPRSPGLARARERGATSGSGMSSSGYTPTRRRSSSARGSVGSAAGTPGPGGAGPGAGGADGWWGSRRVAAALTSLAKMRQSADNVCVLVCRARRWETSPPALEAAEDGQETRKTTPVKTPVKAKTPVKTPSKFPSARAKTPSKTPSKSPSKSQARTPQRTPGSARDAKRARGGEGARKPDGGTPGGKHAVAPSAS